MPVEIPTDNLEVYSKQMAEKINLGLAELRRLPLVENMVGLNFHTSDNVIDLWVRKKLKTTTYICYEWTLFQKTFKCIFVYRKVLEKPVGTFFAIKIYFSQKLQFTKVFMPFFRKKAWCSFYIFHQFIKKNPYLYGPWDL